MSLRQIRSILIGLQLFWRKCFERDGAVTHEDCQLEEVIVVQESTRNESVVSLRTEISEPNVQAHKHDEILEKLKNEIEKIETRKQQEFERRIRNLECKLNEDL